MDTVPILFLPISNINFTLSILLPIEVLSVVWPYNSLICFLTEEQEPQQLSLKIARKQTESMVLVGILGKELTSEIAVPVKSA